jgi:hypothetical protein
MIGNSIADDRHGNTTTLTLFALPFEEEWWIQLLLKKLEKMDLVF